MNRKSAIYLLLGAEVLLVGSGASGEWVQRQMLVTPEPDLGFGHCVAVDGDYAIVGQFRDSVGVGHAHILERTEGVWRHQAAFSDPDGVGEMFGYSVGIAGCYAAVSDYGLGDRGKVHVYRRGESGWAEHQELIVGHVKSLAIDDDWLMVGVPGDDSVRVYRLLGETWTEQPCLAMARDHHDFGYSVALSGDVLVVGDYDCETGSGSAFVFQWQGAAWVHQAELVSSYAEPGDFFGAAVATDGERIVVGAERAGSGAASIFERVGSRWQESARLTAPPEYLRGSRWFGQTLAIQDETLVVGDPFDEGEPSDRRSGAVYIFERHGAQWDLANRMTDQAAWGNHLGVSVAIEEETIFAGAYFGDTTHPVPGAVYVYGEPGTLVWDGGGDGNWGDARWVGLTPPDFPDETRHAVVATNTVTVVADRSAASLTVESGAVVIASGGSLAVVGNVDVGPDAALHVGGRLHANSLTTAGTSTFGDGATMAVAENLSLQSDVDMSGTTVTVGLGSGGNGLNVTAGGRASVYAHLTADRVNVAGGMLRLYPGADLNAATMELSAGMIALPGGCGVTVMISESLTVDASLQITGVTVSVGPAPGGGGLNVGPGGTVNVSGDLTAGRVDVTGGLVSLHEGGALGFTEMSLSGGTAHVSGDLTGGSLTVTDGALCVNPGAHLDVGAMELAGGTTTAAEGATIAVRHSLTLRSSLDLGRTTMTVGQTAGGPGLSVGQGGTVDVFADLAADSVTLTGGALNLNEGANLNVGTMELSGGTTAFAAEATVGITNSLTVRSELDVGAARMTVGNVPAGPGLSVGDGGTVSVLADLAADSVRVTGGTLALGASAALHVGTMELSGGTTTLADGAAVAVSDSLTLRTALDVTGAEVCVGGEPGGPGLSVTPGGSVGVFADLTAGDVRVRGGALALHAGARLNAQAAELSGGTIEVSGSVAAGSVCVTGGALSVTGGANVTVAAMELSGGSTTLGEGAEVAIGESLTLHTPLDVGGGRVSVGAAPGEASLNVGDGGTVNAFADLTAGDVGVSGGILRLKDGAHLNVARIELTGGTVDAAAGQVVVGEQLRVSELTLGVTGGTFQAGGSNLADRAAPGRLTLTGGTMSISEPLEQGPVLVISDEPVGGKDDPLVARLESFGYAVDTSGLGGAYREGEDPFADPAKLAALDAADLVVVSRCTDAACYDGDRQNWNELAKPLILMNGYLACSGTAGDDAWGWTTDGVGDASRLAHSMVIEPGQEDHPFVAGLMSPVQAFDWSPLGRPISPAAPHLPNAGTVRDGSALVGTFDGRPFLIDLPPGFELGGEYGTTAARRAFLSHWGYTVGGYTFDDFLTDGFGTMLENTLAELMRTRELRPLDLANMDIAVAADTTVELPASRRTLFGDLELAGGVNLTLTGGGAEFDNVAAGDGAGIEGEITIAGELSVGDSPGTLDVLGELTMGAESVFLWELGQAACDTVAVEGDLHLADGWTLKLLDAGGLCGPAEEFDLFTCTGLLSFGDYTLDDSEVAALGTWDLSAAEIRFVPGRIYLTGLSVVPEPSSSALLLLAAAVAMLRRKRRKKGSWNLF